MGEIAGGEIGKVAFRQGLKLEARAARAQQELAGIARRFERDLRPLRQFADDLIENMRRQGRRARLGDVGRQLVGHFEIEVGRFQQDRAAVGAEQNVGENRDRRAPFDDAVHMAERLQQSGAFEGDLHETNPDFLGLWVGLLAGRRGARRARGATVARLKPNRKRRRAGVPSFWAGPLSGKVETGFPFESGLIT